MELGFVSQLWRKNLIFVQNCETRFRMEKPEFEGQGNANTARDARIWDACSFLVSLSQCRVVEGKRVTAIVFNLDFKDTVRLQLTYQCMT